MALDSVEAILAAVDAVDAAVDVVVENDANEPNAEEAVVGVRDTLNAAMEAQQMVDQHFDSHQLKFKTNASILIKLERIRILFEEWLNS